MCDLDEQESTSVVESLVELQQVAAQLTAHIEGITATNFMNHEELAALLATLADKAASARAWVQAKPLAHAEHHEH